MNIRFFKFFIGAILFAILACTVDAAPTQTVNQLYHKLRTLPQETPFIRVKALVTDLIKLDPLKASIYFHVGVDHIPLNEDARANAENLANRAIKIVRKADITRSQRKHIVRAIISAVSSS